MSTKKRTKKILFPLRKKNSCYFVLGCFYNKRNVFRIPSFTRESVFFGFRSVQTPFVYILSRCQSVGTYVQKTSNGYECFWTREIPKDSLKNEFLVETIVLSYAVVGGNSVFYVFIPILFNTGFTQNRSRVKLNECKVKTEVY